jgi:hypothetical protein
MLKIIARLWSSVYDLLLYINGNPTKTLEQIHEDLDVIEYMCRPYADADDIGFPPDETGTMDEDLKERV